MLFLGFHFTCINVDASSMQVNLPQSTPAFTTSLTEPFDSVLKFEEPMGRFL